MLPFGAFLIVRDGGDGILGDTNGKCKNQFVYSDENRE